MRQTRRLLSDAVLLVLMACGEPTVPHQAAPPPQPTPRFGHVVAVVEENTNYESVRDGLWTPYLNSLASQYALATQYYANTHPSIGNYFMLTTGKIITNDDDFSGTVTDDNVHERPPQRLRGCHAIPPSPNPFRLFLFHVQRSWGEYRSFWCTALRRAPACLTSEEGELFARLHARVGPQVCVIADCPAAATPHFRRRACA